MSRHIRLEEGGPRIYKVRDGPDFEPGDSYDVDDDLAEHLLTSTDYFEEVEAESTDDGGDTVEEQIDAGECPWCDEYEGENVGQHAASAHADAWDDYKEE